MLQGAGDTNERARSLRRSMTLPEVLLWNALRARPGGLKFRRQHPSGPYIADFYCHERRLVVEVDGEAHSRGDQPARDAARDRWFTKRGINLIRIPATAILNNIDGAVHGIVATAETIDP
jgi:very-short-patch-repair endonuclease